MARKLKPIAKPVLTHNGVTIFYVFKWDTPNQGVLDFWFDNKERSSERDAVDVRALATDPKVLALATEPLNPKTDDGKHQILKLAIDAGIIVAGPDAG